MKAGDVVTFEGRRIINPLGDAQRAALFDYEAQLQEPIEACNLCGGDDHYVSSLTDRYGYRVGLDSCGVCGLVYLNPRMTREAYARFYESGAYRKLVSAFHGREINAETIQPEQEVYGERLARIIDAVVVAEHGTTILDVGASTGVVSAIVAGQLCGESTILDPSKSEMEAQGWQEAIHSTIEDFEPLGRTWDLVLMCQTADHLLDLMGSLKKIRGLLANDGLFWSDIVDFDVTKEVKIDHPFNLTERTYREFLKRAGFRLLQMNYAADGVHVGFLCR